MLWLSFAPNGKRVRKKDLGLIATTYGYVYVAQIAMGANQAHTLKGTQKVKTLSFAYYCLFALYLARLEGRYGYVANGGKTRCRVWLLASLALQPRAW